MLDNQLQCNNCRKRADCFLKEDYAEQYNNLNKIVHQYSAYFWLRIGLTCAIYIAEEEPFIELEVQA